MWNFALGGTCRIEELIVAAGTVNANDCLMMADVAGNVAPQGTRATAAGNVAGIALATVASPGTVPMLVQGRILLTGGGSITAGKAIYGADSSSRPLVFADQSVNEGGAGNYTIYYNRKLGIALTTCTGAGAPFWAMIQR